MNCEGERAVPWARRIQQVILAGMLLTLGQSALADDRDCDWISLGGCLHNLYHDIAGLGDDVEDMWDDVEDIFDQVVTSTSTSLLGMVQDIDGFLDNTEASFNTARSQFDHVTGTMLTSFAEGVEATVPVFEREFLDAQAFASSCAGGTACGVFRANILSFLGELNTLTGELLYFYDEVPADSPLQQVEGIRSAIEFIPSSFLYPLYRAMDELDFSFAEAADEVADLNASLVVLKQLNPAGALSASRGLRYGLEQEYTGKYGYVSAAAATDPFYSADQVCDFIAANRDDVDMARYIAYGSTVFIKGVGVVLRMIGKTVQTEVQAQAFGTTGAAIKIDKTSALGVFLSGTADALFQVLGATTTRIYFCDVSTQLASLGNAQVDANIALATQHNEIKAQVTTLGVDLGEQLEAIETNLTTQLDEVRAQLDWIRSCLPSNSQGQGNCKYP